MIFLSEGENLQKVWGWTLQIIFFLPKKILRAIGLLLEKLFKVVWGKETPVLLFCLLPPKHENLTFQNIFLGCEEYLLIWFLSMKNCDSLSFNCDIITMKIFFRKMNIVDVLILSVGLGWKNLIVLLEFMSVRWL